MFSRLKRNLAGHKGHMWMMAVCCGLPIVGLLAIGVIGISLPSLETFLLLLCPVGMIVMMYLMHRGDCSGGRLEERGDSGPMHKEASVSPDGPATKSQKASSRAGIAWLKA